MGAIVPVDVAEAAEAVEHQPRPREQRGVKVELAAGSPTGPRYAKLPHVLAVITYMNSGVMLFAVVLGLNRR